MDVDRVMEDHFAVDEDGTVRLKATACERCGSRWYPARTVCAKCRNSPLEPILAGHTATVYAATTVRTGGAPGFTTPYSLAYLDIDGLRVLAHVKSPEGQQAPARPGTRVRLRAEVIDGDARLSAYVAYPGEEGNGDDA